jgi:hypothetical protein
MGFGMPMEIYFDMLLSRLGSSPNTLRFTVEAFATSFSEE